MAKLKGIQFTGRLDGITAYTRADVDGVIIRKSEGIDGRRVKYGPEFVRSRENSTEFGGCSKAASAVRDALIALVPQQDYNFTNQLRKVFMHVVLMDKENLRGERNILLSKAPRILEGFNLNKKVQLDSIVRTNFAYTISRETYSATIDIPGLVHGINLIPPRKHPMFQIVVTLGIVPDLKYTEHGYIPVNDHATGCVSANTPWHAVKAGLEPTTLELSMSIPPASGEALSLVLSVGIAFGEMITDTVVQQVKRTGAAKILGIV